MNKKIVIRNILLGLLMTSLSIWTIRSGSVLGWISTVFFGCATAIFITKLLNPNIQWLKDTDVNSKEFKALTEKEFNKVFNDTGIFTFSENGFSVKTSKGVQAVNWHDVKTMLGYKEDHYATDCICLDVFCQNDFSFKITEETLGWFKFLDHSKKALVTINKSWEIEIATPVFETSLTLVYDKQNRPLHNVIKECYKSL